MRTIIITLIASLIIAATCFAWGDRWGGKRYGADNWGEAQWGSGGSGISEGDALLLENGDFLLLENGDKLLLE